MWRAGENFENSEGSAEMAQRGGQERPNTQPLADRHIYIRIVLGIMAEHDLARAYTVGGNPGIRLKTNAQVRCGAPGTCPAHHFVALAQGNRRTARARERLRPLGDQANSGLQVNVS